MKKIFPILFSLTLVICNITACAPVSGPDNSQALSQDAVILETDIPYDFSQQAQTYLEYIGTNLRNRNVTVNDEQPEADNTHAETIDWILSELKNAGYEDAQITCKIENGQTDDNESCSVQNIVLRVEGEDTSRQVIVGAHYDGDGVGDNGSGIALLLSTACGLVKEKPLYNVTYIFFDAEEVGSVGANLYGNAMTAEEIASTVFMVNIDSLAFGDYCNVYGGFQNEDGTVTQTEAYELAIAKATAMGMNVYTPENLDGYYEAHGEGPEIEDNTLYTNPWTLEHPAPKNGGVISPTTVDWSDHEAFKYLGIPYVYMEATNWFAAGTDDWYAYTGYIETLDSTLGEGGMFMNTEYDTLENLNSLFPGRSLSHFQIFSPLLGSLIMNPASAE